MFVSRRCVGACLVWITSVASLASCDSEVGNAGDNGKVRVVAAPVVGGEPTDPCDWPSTVMVNSCTGTLIHPRVITTAGHCLSWSNRATFTAGEGEGGSFSVNVVCQSGARFGSGGGSSRDWAYCVLPEDERIEKFPITPPLVGCEAEQFLKAGGTAWVVGFGETGANRGDYGVKREVEVEINAVRDGIVDIGDREVGACHGDSGGPLYVRIHDGTHDWGWRVAGSVSSAGSANCDCTCNTIYVDIQQHVQAIEQETDFDVTPCTDEDGEWDPSPLCTGFISDPQEGTGTFPTCSVPRVTEAIETCGAGIAPTGGGGGMDASGGTGGGGVGGVGGASATGGSGGSGGMGGAGAIGGMVASGGMGGDTAGGSGGMNAGAGGAGGMIAAGVGGGGGAIGGAGGAAGMMQPIAGGGGVAGQASVPMGGVGAGGGVGGGPAVGSGSEASAGCGVTGDARGASGGLIPIVIALIGLRSVRRVHARRA